MNPFPVTRNKCSRRLRRKLWSQRTARPTYSESLVRYVYIVRGLYSLHPLGRSAAKNASFQKGDKAMMLTAQILNENIEAALERALKGTTTVGLKTKHFVVLAADRRATSGYYVAHKRTRKIIQVTDYMVVTTAGLVADAQVLAEWLSNYARYHYYVTKHRLSVRAAAEYLAAILRGSRSSPYIVQLLLGGYDNAPRLFNIDWFGSVTEEKFVATGSGSPTAIGVLEDQYSEDLNEDQALDLAVRAVYSSIRRDSFTGNGVDAALISDKGVKWYHFDLEELVSKYRATL